MREKSNRQRCGNEMPQDVFSSEFSESGTKQSDWSMETLLERKETSQDDHTQTTITSI